MADIIIPTWHHLEDTVRNAHHQLVVCTPYYTDAGVGRVFDHLPAQAALAFWTRLSPSDWLSRVSDPKALCVLLDLLGTAGHPIELLICQRLHAKAYVADGRLALVGSSNLSEGGFHRNLELMVRLQDEDASQVSAHIENTYRPHARSLTPDQLRTWVEQYETQIEQVRRKTEEAEAHDLEQAQRSLDELLGYGQHVTPLQEPTREDLDGFVRWLRSRTDLPGAQALVNRHDNTDGQNLTGHFKQSFFASLRFLREHSDLQQSLSEALSHLRADDVYQLDTAINDAWLQHVDQYATVRGDGYSYAVLRGILPPTLGGTRLGGGGGSGTIKRMLPLVARFIEEGP